MQPVKSTFTPSKRHCAFVFDCLLAQLNSRPKPKFPANLDSASTPLFVTYYKGANKNLRGCIGTFSEELTSSLLPRYALIAAFEDTRFEPIKLSEVPKLSVEVSFLTDFEPCDDPFDWVFGKHGINIEFKPQGSKIIIQ